MGCCCSKQDVRVHKAFPEDQPNQGDEYTKTPWEYKIFAKDVAHIRKGTSGLAADEPLTVAGVFKEAAELFPDKPALRFEAEFQGKKDFKTPEEAESGDRETWKTWTWSEFYKESTALAKANLAMGLEEAEGVAIWGFNSPYWTIAAMSGMIGGGVTMGIYPTDTPDIVAYKLKHCSTVVAFVETAKHQKVIEKLYAEQQLEVGVDSKFTKLKAIVCWGTPDKAGTDVQVFSWGEYLELGNKQSDKELEGIMENQAPGKVVNYCYTSGTTGLPKAVMLTNDNLTWNAKATLATTSPNLDYPEEIRTLSYLPLSHVAATMLDMLAPVMTTSGKMPSPGLKGSYWCVHFVRPYDLKKGTIKNRLVAVRPSIFLAVPRVWEKIEFTMRQMAKTGCVGAVISSLKAKLLQNQKNLQIGGNGKTACCTCLANVIANGIKEKLGLDQSLFNITGAAPIRRETVEYFASIGIAIYDLYGMSEMTATATANKMGASKWGSIGGKMDGQEVGVFNERGEQIADRFKDDGTNIPEACCGELRSRGRNVMMGYLANPDLGKEHVDEILKKNQSTITPDGWLCSGDQAAVSDEGMFRITGRIKELIITAGGENVAPVPMEENVKVTTNIVSNIMMFGDKKPYNCALVTVRCQGYTGELLGSNKLERIIYKKAVEEKQIAEPDCKTVDELIPKSEDHPLIKEIIAAIDATNKNNLCCPSNACKIQKFTILPRDFSVEHGELTPTMKLKRSVVAKMYSEAIENIYSAPREAKYVAFNIES